MDIDIFAECTARAVASVFARAFVAISCEGQGAGCGFAQANADAWACSFASAIAQLFVDVGNGEAVCDVDVGAMASVFASAAADAQAAACASGNEFASAFEIEFVTRVETIIADAAASCFVTCFPGNALNIAIRWFMFRVADRFAVADADGSAGVSLSPSFVSGNAPSSGGAGGR